MTFEHGAALGTALAALFALWLAERRSRLDARRTFVEFALRQRTDAAGELVAALTNQMHVLEQACFWLAELRANRNVEVATRERNRVRDDLLPPSLKRMNDALGVANVAFSVRVRAEANNAVVSLNNLMNNPVPVFDRPAALALLTRVADAIRTEMLFPEVLKYQERLFKPKWWERRIGGNQHG